MTIARKLTLGFVSLTALSLGLSGLAAERIGYISSLTTTITNNNLPGTVAAGRIEAHINKCFGYVARACLTEDRAVVQKIIDQRKIVLAAVLEDIRSYEAKVSEQEDRANFEKLKFFLNDYVSKADRAIGLASEGQNKQAFELFEAGVAPAAKLLTDQAAVLDAWNADGAKHSGELSVTAVSNTRWMLWAGMFGSGVVSGVLAWWIVRSTNGALRRIVEILQTGSSETASASARSPRQASPSPPVPVNRPPAWKRPARRWKKSVQ
ncbi:MAG: MCP four helix bundle domain-containing protein [Tepidisphaeraceae bacterium]